MFRIPLTGAAIICIAGCMSGTGELRTVPPDNSSPYVFDYLGTKRRAINDLDTLLKRLGFTIDTVDTVSYVLRTEPKILEYDEREKAKFIIESGFYNTKIPQDKGVLAFNLSDSETDPEMVQVVMKTELQPEGPDSVSIQQLPRYHPFSLKIARILRRTGLFEPRER
ncbi:MAG: hypothetical protein GF350_16075, partial [Chitinivibrionales bacterium]|nr:hypothetical protein [Chitinivibrionales bacterium]